MAGIPWTTEESNLLRKYVNQGMPFKDIAKHIITRTACSLQMQSRKLGLSNPVVNRTYSADREFWSNPNEINSYFAGFWAADGNVSLVRSCYTARIELHHADREIMEKFIYHCKSDSRIRDYRRVHNGTKIHHCVLAINEQSWKKGLEENFNIYPRKTWSLEVPQLPFNLWACWMAGFLDGDGCYSVHPNGLLSISASAACKNPLESVKAFSRLFPSTIAVNKKKSEVLRHSKGQYDDLYQFHVFGQTAVKMAHYLMSLPCPHMARKYNKVRDYLIANPKYNLSLPTLEDHEKMHGLTSPNL